MRRAALLLLLAASASAQPLPGVLDDGISAAARAAAPAAQAGRPSTIPPDQLRRAQAVTDAVVDRVEAGDPLADPQPSPRDLAPADDPALATGPPANRPPTRTRRIARAPRPPSPAARMDPAPPPGASPVPGVTLTDTGEYALPVQLLLLLTVLTLAPSILILMTSFTRLVVVFAILRTALGMQQSPPTQVLIGLSLFLTFFVMNPVFTEIDEAALQPYLNGDLEQSEALEVASKPIKGFMIQHTRDKDLVQFMDLGGLDPVAKPTDVPLHVLVPAFVVSELRVAFQIGFLLFLPFLVVDLIVASVLMSMGMMMLPPVMISLPIKLLLFVLTDGWYLIVESVVRGYLG